jgi:sugar-specific transcriptional regulator TrmB
MDIGILEEIGLSKNEVKVFLSLLKKGESKAGSIISETNLQSSAVYNAINSLIKKGFISFIKKSQIRYYKACEPETITDYIETKKQEYLSLLPQLKKYSSTQIEGVEFFKSIKGIKIMLFELIKDANIGDIYRFFSVENPEKYKLATEKVYELQKPLRMEKGIKIKGLFHERTRDIAKKATISKKRYLNFPMPPNTQIINNKVAIISWEGDEPSGILIRSKDIAKTYINFFEHMWDIAKE